MARAETKTWLSLDRWAEIIGLNPLHFNQLASTEFPDLCGQPWYQFDWQDADRAGRESIAQAIRLAERRIAKYLGYNLIPDWTDEIVMTPRPASPELFGYATNPRWARKSVNASKGHLISGGIKASSVIEAGAAIVRTDVDGDTYFEHCTVTVVTDVADCEIRVYYPGESGSEDWEIRPIKVSSAGGVATITFKSWQIVKPELQSVLNPEPATAETDTNYVTTVDVYRVYNDPQTQVLFMWEQMAEFCNCSTGSCSQCSWGTQNGCLQVRDNRLGIVTFAPGTWDAVNEYFTKTSFSIGREPEKMRLYYYSGFEDKDRACPRRDMDQALEKAIAHFAATLLDRDMCACNNVQNYLDYWREDLSRVGADVTYQNSPMLLGNPFGTMRGAVHAYKICNDEGRKIGK